MLLTVIYALKGRCLMTKIRLWIARQQKSLHLYTDLTGPIQPLSKDAYEYVLNFIDDYSDLTMLYFLKQVQYIACYRQTTEWSSLLKLFNGYLYLIESNASSQLLILLIKMGLLNGHVELYFLWQGVSLLSQNCLKNCGFAH